MISDVPIARVSQEKMSSPALGPDCRTPETRIWHLPMAGLSRQAAALVWFFSTACLCLPVAEVQRFATLVLKLPPGTS